MHLTRITKKPPTGLARHGLAAAGALVCAGLIADAASAQQRQPSPRDSQCAIYGSDFVAVQGTSSCVRIGGRVRLEVSTSRMGNAYAPTQSAPAPFAMPGGALAGPPPATAGDGLNRAHLRLESGSRGRR